MLALAYAAEHPVDRLVLIGCGTFDEQARAELIRRRNERCPELRELQARLEETTDADEKSATLERMGELVQAADTYERTAEPPAEVFFDGPGHFEAWADMMRLQREGVYPAAFSRIEAPVVMLHGAEDPHPGPLIRDGLRNSLPQLEYVEFRRCGHTPWIEEQARASFLAELRTRVR